MKANQLIFVLALGFGLTGITAAQDQANGPQHRGRPGAMIRAFLLKKADTDGDRKLSEAERAAALEQIKTNHPDLFAKADTDGDGKISIDERRAAAQAIRKHLLAKFDADGDGKLNEQERQAAKDAFLQRTKGGAAK